MTNVYIGWVVAAAVLVAIGIYLGSRFQGRPLGILIDSRGRYSLSQTQLVLWTMVVLPLFAGVFWGRLLGGSAQTALSFSIPQDLLFVFGISLASTGAAIAAKSYKDGLQPSTVLRTDPTKREKGKAPFFAQVFLVEEGAMADRSVDVTKFQQFWVTVVLVAAYVALAIGKLVALGDVTRLDSLPDLSQQMVILLGISHTGYIAGKLPQRAEAAGAETQQ